MTQALVQTGAITPADLSKLCPHCNCVKPVAQFYKSRSRSDGLQACCKECQKQKDHHRRQQPKPLMTAWGPTAIARFWSLVDITDSCWLWKGSLTHNGYGRVQKDDRHYLAHRAAFEIVYGRVAAGLNICHSCDVNYPIGDLTYRRCVRPEHLFVGTTADNVADRCRKGRTASGDRHGFRKHPECHPRGEQNSSSKLTERQVAEILQNHETATAIAVKYGVSKSTIDKIRERRLWTHVQL